MRTSQPHRSKISRGPWLWPLLLSTLGVLLLFSNFLFFDSFSLISFWPLILVILGLQILLRGDILPASSYQPFGITRGSLEQAILEISSGEIDVQLISLPEDNRERLIAGQYAHQSRPELKVRNHSQAILRLDRTRTPWLSFANWELGLSQHLPWQIIVTSYLGQITADLHPVIVQNAFFSTGLAEIQVALPHEAFNPIYVRSVVGPIRLQAAPQTPTRITVESSRFINLNINVDSERYVMVDENVFQTVDVTFDEAHAVMVVVRSTFGDIHIT